MPLDNPNTRLSGQPRTAALVPATKLRTKLRAGNASGDRWQHKVIKADRDGPGVLGYYLDLIQLLATLCPLRPEVMQRDGTWEFSDDPVLAVTLAGYRSDLYTQSELVGLQVRHREAIGETWIIYSDDVGWVIATIPNVRIVRGGEFVEFTDPYGDLRRVPRNRAWRSWTSDPYEPSLAHSPCRRALDDLRRLRAATRNQTRSAESRLVMNGLIAFPPDGEGARPLRDAANGGSAVQQGAEQIVDDFIELAKEAFDDDDSPAASVPFPYVGGKAEYVEVGRGIDGGAIEVEKIALEAFARDVNFPAQLLTIGPGAANHWNEWLLQEVQHKMGLAPKLRPACDDITEFYYRPMLQKLKNRVGSWTIDPSRVRAGFDMSFLTAKPDTTAQIIEAYRLLLVTREEAAERLGIATVPELPKGLSEYEHWELATGSKGAPYAEVDADGALIVPDLGADPFADPAADPMADPAALPPAPDQAPVEETTTDTQSPPAPPPQLAAARDPEEVQIDALVDSLADVDRRLDARLMGLASAVQTAIAVEVAKEAIRQFPRHSPERAALRNLPVEEVWQASPPDVKARVDVAAIADRVANQHREEAQAAFEEAVAEASEAWEETGWGVPQYLAAIGAAVLLLGVVDEVTDFFEGMAKAPMEVIGEGVDIGLGKNRHLRVRPSVVRAATSAAAGAQVSVRGQVVPTASRVPEATDGEPWAGSNGMALGHNAAQHLRRARPNVRIAYKWHHSFFGKPEEPFAPHLALDGELFDSPADVPGGYAPGDHAWCRCALLWVPQRLR